MRFLGLKVVLVFAIAALAGEFSNAQESDYDAGGSPSQACPNNRVLSGKLITDICWGCLFPIKMGPVELGGGDVPGGAADDFFCSCKNDKGIPQFGNAIGMWEPAYLVDAVRAPGCSPSLGGIILPGVNERMWGTRNNSEFSTTKKSFTHYHFYSFPLVQMLDLYRPGICNTGGIVDFDLLYPSEMDPTWMDDELAFFTNPEATAVANIPAQSACSASSAAAAAGKNIDDLWWCAGSWGSLYPFSGHAAADGMPRITSLTTMRGVAAQHRRGLMRKTMGSDQLCGATIEPMLPKSQYRLNMFWPVAEAKDNHVFGETQWNWGLNRTIPRTGEDATYMLWRWKDCCNVY